MDRYYTKLRELKIGTIITDAAARMDVLHMQLTIPKAFIRFVGNWSPGRGGCAWGGAAYRMESACDGNTLIHFDGALHRLSVDRNGAWQQHQLWLFWRIEWPVGAVNQWQRGADPKRAAAADGSQSHSKCYLV